MQKGSLPEGLFAELCQTLSLFSNIEGFTKWLTNTIPFALAMALHQDPPQLLEFRPYDLPSLFARSSHYLHLLPSGPDGRDGHDSDFQDVLLALHQIQRSVKYLWTSTLPSKSSAISITSFRSREGCSPLTPPVIQHTFTNLTLTIDLSILTPEE
jgi:hypothetical protein